MNYPKINYYGNKEKLADWIIDHLPINKGTVLDGFSGGGSMSYAFKKHGFQVISNDSLYASFCIAKGLIENDTDTLPLNLTKQVMAKDVTDKYALYRFLDNRYYYPQETEELVHYLEYAEHLKGHDKYLMLALIRRAMIRKSPRSRMDLDWNTIQLLRDEDYSYEKFKRRRAYHNWTFTRHIDENLESYNNAIFSNGLKHTAYHSDIFDRLKHIDNVDLIYLDPPYPNTLNQYDAFYGLFDDLFDKRIAHYDLTKSKTFLTYLNDLLQLAKTKTDYVVMSMSTKSKPHFSKMEQCMSQFGHVQTLFKQHDYHFGKRSQKNKEILMILTFND